MDPQARMSRHKKAGRQRVVGGFKKSGLKTHFNG